MDGPQPESSAVRSFRSPIELWTLQGAAFEDADSMAGSPFRADLGQGTAMSAATTIGEMRWRDYVMVRGGGVESFWAEHGCEPGRRLLFVVGRGFDPRAPFG